MVGLPPNKRLFFVFSLTFFEAHELSPIVRIPLGCLCTNNLSLCHREWNQLVENFLPPFEFSIRGFDHLDFGVISRWSLLPLLSLGLFLQGKLSRIRLALFKSLR